MDTPLLTAGTDYVYCMDAERFLRMLPDNSVDCIVTDPPFNIGKASWDTWESIDAFIAWLDSHLRGFRRVLKPNGSLYLFCATKYSADVEIAVRKHFNVLNSIRWKKPPFSTKAEMFDKDTMRSFFPASETIIFAEQYAANDAYTFADYELNGKVYAPLKNWFRERARGAGIVNQEFNIRLGFASNGGGVASGVIGDKVEFSMPTAEVYQRMQNAYPTVFNRDYADLRREYEDLRREYEDLRRPFNGSPELPYTDVWEYETVNTYPGKHPCEKPLDMMRDVIRISSREGAVILDPFCGSGSTLVAAKELKRRYIGGDFDQYWVERTNWRLQLPQQLELFAD
jgi:adenine-specific DNA-methyltransferase